MFEGQEEIGSPNLSDLLKKHKKLLSADFALSADGGQISETQVAHLQRETGGAISWYKLWVMCLWCAPVTGRLGAGASGRCSIPGGGPDR